MRRFIARLMTDAIDEAGKALQTGVETVSGAKDYAVGSVTGVFQMSAQKMRDTVQGSRNLAADAAQTGGSAIGTAGGIAGEAALLSGGIIPFLIFGGLPLELGAAFADACAGLSQSVRGNSPQFIGVNHMEGGLFTSETMLGIVYDPAHPKKDSAGFVQLGEKELAANAQYYQDDGERWPLYLAALVAVQDAKKHFGIGLETEDLTARTAAKTPAP